MSDLVGRILIGGGLKLVGILAAYVVGAVAVSWVMFKWVNRVVGIAAVILFVLVLICGILAVAHDLRKP